MPQSDSDELLGAVDEGLVGIEALCLDLERALAARDWRAIGQALADSRRLQHALRNAIEAAASRRTQEFDALVGRRIERVRAIRSDQLVRLQRYRETVRERLTTIAKFKAFAKSAGAKPRGSRLANLDQLR